MKFRIIASLLIVAVLAILAISIDSGSSNSPVATPSSPDDGAMKGLKID